MKSKGPCQTCARIRRVLPLPLRERLERIEKANLQRKRNATPKFSSSHHD